MNLMNIEDIDMDDKWFQWIVEENCGIMYESYVINEKVLSMRILEKNLNKIIKKLENIKDELSASIGYQILTVLILRSGSFLPEKVRERVIRYTTTDFDKKMGWSIEITNLRRYYFNDLRTKMNQHKPGCPTYLADLKIGYDMQFQSTSIGLESLKRKIETGEINKYLYINLDECNLHYFPRELIQLKNIILLSLEHNNITSIPTEISNLENLEYLYLGFNKIREIPRSIISLKNLKSISLNNNKLNLRPNWIKRSIILNLKDNPLRFYPINNKTK